MATTCDIYSTTSSRVVILDQALPLLVGSQVGHRKILLRRVMYVALGLARARSSDLRLPDYFIAFETRSAASLTDVIVGRDAWRSTYAQSAYRRRLLAKVTIARREVLLLARIRDLRLLLVVRFGLLMLVSGDIWPIEQLLVVRHLTRHHRVMYRYLLLPGLLEAA